ncbi:hypothetical protein E2C01_047125 [Portunus trituberculatus]|uniref:Uncharacterized protein n=1 Tax=Portunus trituberculatus TaxID=210409 RepID=A0A5B7G6X0_PORTR|nr:hypothetical protein [Portunus trituberculatus]
MHEGGSFISVATSQVMLEIKLQHLGTATHTIPQQLSIHAGDAARNRSKQRITDKDTLLFKCKYSQEINSRLVKNDKKNSRSESGSESRRLLDFRPCTLGRQRQHCSLFPLAKLEQGEVTLPQIELNVNEIGSEG